MTVQRVRKAVIPTAGLGTRFLPATKAIPKEMIPIVDVPMIQLIVEEAVKSGIEDVILVTARHKEMIENHFDFNYELDDVLEKRGKEELLEISRSVGKLCNVISIRQKNPLGLGHAVLTAAPIVGNEPFAVLLGDEWIVSKNPCTRQLAEVYSQEGISTIAMMQVPKTEVSKYGIVGGKLINDRMMKIEKVVEKPAPHEAPSQFALPGRYVLSPKIFEYLKDVKPSKGGEIQLTDGLEMLARKEGLYGFQFEGLRFDTGDRVGYLDATLHLALSRPELREATQDLIRKYSKEL